MSKKKTETTIRHFNHRGKPDSSEHALFYPVSVEFNDQGFKLAYEGEKNLASKGYGQFLAFCNYLSTKLWSSSE